MKNGLTVQNTEGLTNREFEYFQSARAKYQRLLRKCTFELSILEKVVCAVQVIETINRPALWRFFEYVFLCLAIPRFLVSKKLTNMSIGAYQLKIVMILHYLGYDCELERKTITVRKATLFMIQDIFANRNNPAILIEYFGRFHITSSKTDTQINVASLRRALIEYSRNVEFAGSLNYYTLCRFLLFGLFPDKS